MNIVRCMAAAMAIGLLDLTACGGGGASKTSSTTRTSAASAERTRLESQLRSTLESPTSPVAAAPDLDECLVQQAGALPLASLRELSSSDTNVGRQAAPLVARCMSQGKGVTWFRGVIARSVAGRLTPPIPAAFDKCVLAGVNHLAPGTGHRAEPGHDRKQLLQPAARSQHRRRLPAEARGVRRTSQAVAGLDPQVAAGTTSRPRSRNACSPRRDRSARPS
jgi:hypothetical protein